MRKKLKILLEILGSPCITPQITNANIIWSFIKAFDSTFRRLPKIFWPCRAPLHKAVWEAPWAPQVPPPPSSFSAMFYNILQLCVIVRENGHVRLAGPLQSLQGKHSKHRKIILQVLRSRHDHLTTPAIQCARNYDVFQRTATSKYATIGHSIL